MAYTGQNYADRVREQINDDLKRRVPDAELLNYANDCVKQLYLKRPDLFIGSLTATPADIALGGSLAIPDLYFPAALEYGISMAERPEDDEAHKAISEAAMKKFLRDIYGD
jgi:hypothetical protein